MAPNAAFAPPNPKPPVLVPKPPVLVPKPPVLAPPKLNPLAIAPAAGNAKGAFAVWAAPCCSTGFIPKEKAGAPCGALASAPSEEGLNPAPNGNKGGAPPKPANPVVLGADASAVSVPVLVPKPPSRVLVDMPKTDAPVLAAEEPVNVPKPREGADVLAGAALLLPRAPKMEDAAAAALLAGAASAPFVKATKLLPAAVAELELVVGVLLAPKLKEVEAAADGPPNANSGLLAASSISLPASGPEPVLAPGKLVKVLPVAAAAEPAA